MKEENTWSMSLLEHFSSFEIISFMFGLASTLSASSSVILNSYFGLKAFEDCFLPASLMYRGRSSFWFSISKLIFLASSLARIMELSLSLFWIGLLTNDDLDSEADVFSDDKFWRISSIVLGYSMLCFFSSGENVIKFSNKLFCWDDYLLGKRNSLFLRPTRWRLASKTTSF